MVHLSKDRALEYLQDILGQIPQLKRYDRKSSKYEQWKIYSKRRIRRIFDSEYEKMFSDSLIIYRNDSQSNALDRSATLIEAMIEEVKDEWSDSEQSEALPNRDDNDFLPSNKVFVIHGHDEAVRETVVRFLEKLQLESVILHEQTNEGRTIIEKFEDHADVGFAVVLLTPDDTGGSKRTPDESRDRARQNVVLEFGYFLGKLGRNRVCALVKGNIEKPSDLDGVVYVPLDEGDGWKLLLVRELKAAGFAVDANQAL